MRQKPLDSNSTVTLTPSRLVRQVFGSATASALVGLTTDALRKWDRPVAKGGQGGQVPSRYQPTYLREAKRLGLPLTADQLIAEPVE